MAPLRLAALRLAALAGSALVAAGFRPAEAASFACARATGPVETAICSDTGLSRLDERLASAYSAAARKLGLTLASRNGVPDAQAIAPLRESQRAWIAERNRCGGDVPCLRRQYERRNSVLRFGPDPDAPGPADRFAGRYTDGRLARGAILRLAPDRAMVRLHDAEPTQGRWLCEFQGLGQTSGDGTRLVATYDGEPGYTLSISPRGLTIDDDTGGGVWCGMGGAIASPLRPRAVTRNRQ